MTSVGEPLPTEDPVVRAPTMNSYTAKAWPPPLLLHLDSRFGWALARGVGLIAFCVVLQGCTTASGGRELDSEPSSEMPWQEQMQIDELFLKKANQAPSSHKSKPRTSASL